MVIIIDGELLRVSDFQHVKQARGSAFVRATLRNVRTGATVARTFSGSDKFPDVQLQKKKVQFLYREGDNFYFMDNETYDQPVVSTEIVGDTANYLIENETVDLLTYEDEVIELALPPNVVLRVRETDPGFKGDTASGGGKPAIMETGLRVIVPFFIEEGDQLRIDTRNGAYVERA
jgi:elongation factor P